MEFVSSGYPVQGSKNKVFVYNPLSSARAPGFWEADTFFCEILKIILKNSNFQILTKNKY